MKPQHTHRMQLTSVSIGPIKNTIFVYRPPVPMRGRLRCWPIAPRASKRGRCRFQGQPIAVCLELTKRPLVDAWQKYDFFVLFPVNPSTLAKYRQAFTPSGAKDDPSDARLQLELLMPHRDTLKALHPEGIEMRTLQYLVEQRRGLVDDRVRVTNQLTYALKQYFLHVLDWFKDKDTRVFCDFISRCSSPLLNSIGEAAKTT